MEKFDPIDIEFILNSEEVIRDAKKVKAELRSISAEGEDASKKVSQQIKELTNANKEQLSVEEQVIAARKKHMENLRATIVRQRESRRGGILNETPEELKEAKNNIADVAKEVGNLGTETEETAKKQDKASGSTKRLINRYLGWTAAITLGLELLKQHGPELIKYFTNMLNLQRATEQQALAQQVLNKSLDSTVYKSAISDILELRNVMELAKAGTLDKSIAIDKYNKIIGDTAGKATDLATAEQGLIDNGDIYIEMMFKKAAANLALEEAAQKAVDAEKRRKDVALSDFSLKEQLKLGASILPNDLGGGLITQIFGRDVDVDAAKRRAGEVADVIKKEGESLNEIYARLISEAETAAKKLGKSAFGDGSKDAKKVLDQRKKLIEQIGALDAEFRRKQLDTDEAEIQAVKDKFSKVRALIEEFNKDPKNASARIDVSALDILQQGAEKDLRYTQETKRLNQELEAQKKLFEDFEEYKKQFGLSKAKERFAEEIKEYESYAAVIRAQWDKNKSAFAAVASGDASGAQADRVKLIEKETDAILRAENKKQQNLLASLQGYEEKRAKLIEDYNEVRLKLLADGNFREAEELSKVFKEQLNEIDEANAKSMDAYKALVSGVDSLSAKAASAVVKNAQKMVDALLKAGRLSKSAADDIMREINKVQDNVNSREEDKIAKIANSFGDIGWALTQAGDQITKAVGSMVIEISGALSTLSSSESSGVQKASSLVGLIVQAGSLMNKIGEDKLNKNVNEQKELNRGLAEQLTMEAKINELRRERATLERNSSAFLDSYYKEDFTASIKNQAESELQLVETMKQLSEKGIFSAEGVGKRLLFGKKRENRDFSIKDILGDFDIKGYYHNPEAWIFDPLSIFGGYSDVNVSKDALKQVRNAFDDSLTAMGQTAADMANFSAEEWLDFFTLMDAAGHITDKATKEMLANAQTALEDYKAAMEEMKKIISDFGGQLGNELANNLVQAFRAGESAAEGFKKSLNNILTQLFLQDLINSQFRSYFDTLQKEMQDSMGLDGDQSWIDDIVRFGDTINPALDQGMAAIGAFNEQLKQMGFEGFEVADTANRPGLQGAIRREMTEETASELTGLFRGQYDITKRHLQLHEKHFELERKHYDATLRTIQLSALIERNTAGTVVELKAAVLELRNISKNTKPGQTTRDLGIG